MSEVLKVNIIRQGEMAQDFYRATLPLGKAEQNKAVDVNEIWQSNFLQEASARTDTFFKAMASDIYLIQRLSSTKFMRKIKEFIHEIDLKTKVVLDHDDDFFNVSPMSQSYFQYGTQEAKIQHDGKVIFEWKNGVNIDIDLNLKAMEEFKGALRGADLVTVTTPELGDVFKPYNPNIKVLPNCVDLTQWNRLRILRDNPKEIRICWYGGNSHWEDLILVRDTLKEIAAKYENVKIVIVGYKPAGIINDYRPGQVEFHDWVEFAAHPYRMAALDIDIGVIPLRVTPFNNAKSPIKWIEFSSLKVPCVTSYVTPYKQVADLDEGKSGIFIDGNSKNDWMDGIEMLVNSEQLRQEFGEKGRAVVAQNFDVNTQYHQWIDAYKALLQKVPEGVS